jgi:hypothetical protein
MDNVAVFMEYAQDDSWVATHFVQWLAAVFLMGGFIPVYVSIASRVEKGVVAARFGLAAALLTAAGFTMLQAVDGIALEWAVDAWSAASAADRDALFAAALSVRWTEYALQSYSNLLLGVTLILFAVATGLELGVSALARMVGGWLGDRLDRPRDDGGVRRSVRLRTSPDRHRADGHLGVRHGTHHVEDGTWLSDIITADTGVTSPRTTGCRSYMLPPPTPWTPTSVTTTRPSPMRVAR